MTGHRSIVRAYVSVAAAAATWGTWKLFLAPAHVTAAWEALVAFAMMAVGGSALLADPRARSAVALRDRPRSDLSLLLVIGIADALNNLLFFAAMERTTVAIAVLSHYLAPALVVLLAPSIAKTPAVRGGPVYALVATAGLAFVLAPWRAGGLASHDVAGAVSGAASALFYAVNLCVSRRASARFTPIEILTYHGFTGLPLLAVVVPWRSVPPAGSLAIVAAGALLLSIGAGLLFLRGMARIPPEHAAVLTFLEPVTAVTLGALVFGERMSASAAVGIPIVLAAGVAATRARPARR